MSQLPSTSSIEPPEIFSAGQFDHDCVTPWNRSQWHNGAEDGDLALEFDCVPGQVFCFHGEELRGPDFSTVEERLAFGLRQVCHLLIDRINSSGLQEVCQSLAEFYQYYLPAEEPRKLLPDPRTRDAAMGTRTVRSAFAIEEE